MAVTITTAEDINSTTPEVSIFVFLTGSRGLP